MTTITCKRCGEPAQLSGPALEIRPGWGFRARVEDGRLTIEQDDSEGRTDTVTLSLTEFNVLAVQFDEWSTQ